jgi:hypothetical protein
MSEPFIILHFKSSHSKLSHQRICLRPAAACCICYKPEPADSRYFVGFLQNLLQGLWPYCFFRSGRGLERPEKESRRLGDNAVFNPFGRYGRF